tara:strand:- start:1575 stop:1757 length:183 start_codon:yes stop_codon:yes gene_type:complete
MSVKYDVAALTNGYVSQVHYIISRLLGSDADNPPQKELEELLKLTDQFYTKIKSESKKLK